MKMKSLSVEEAVRIAENYMNGIIGIPVPIFNAMMTLIRSAKERQPSIKGWVARDEDQTLWFHYDKPHKTKIKDSYSNWIWSSTGVFRQLDSKKIQSMFKHLQWEDDPVAVEITIKQLDKNNK